MLHPKCQKRALAGPNLLVTAGAHGLLIIFHLNETVVSHGAVASLVWFRWLFVFLTTLPLEARSILGCLCNKVALFRNVLTHYHTRPVLLVAQVMLVVQAPLSSSERGEIVECDWTIECNNLKMNEDSLSWLRLLFLVTGRSPPPYYTEQRAHWLLLLWDWCNFSVDGEGNSFVGLRRFSSSTAATQGKTIHLYIESIFLLHSRT
jgi:hypothetical protein